MRNLKALATAGTAGIAALSLAAPSTARAPVYKSGSYAGKTKQVVVADFTDKISFKVTKKKSGKGTLSKLSLWAAVECADGNAYALKPTLSSLKIPVSKTGKINFTFTPGNDMFKFTGKIKRGKATGTFRVYYDDYDGHGPCSTWEAGKWSAKKK